MKKVLKITGASIVAIVVLLVVLVAVLEDSTITVQTMIENPEVALENYAFNTPEITVLDMINSTFKNIEYNVAENENDIEIFVTGNFKNETYGSKDICVSFIITDNGERISLGSLKVDGEDSQYSSINTVASYMLCCAIHDKFGSIYDYLSDESIQSSFDQVVLYNLITLYDKCFPDEELLDEVASSAASSSLSDNATYGNFTNNVDAQNTFDKTLCVNFLDQFEIPGFEDIPLGSAIDKFLSINSTWKMEKDPNSDDYSILIRGTSNYISEYIESGNYMFEMAYRPDNDIIDIFFIQLPNTDGIDPYSMGYEPMLYFIADNYCNSIGSSFNEYANYLTETYGNDIGSFKYREIRDALEYLDAYDMSDSIDDSDEGYIGNQSIIDQYSNNVGDDDLIGRWKSRIDGSYINIGYDGRVASNLDGISLPPSYSGAMPDTILCQVANGQINLLYFYCSTLETKFGTGTDDYGNNVETLKLNHIRNSEGKSYIELNSLNRVSGNSGIVGSWASNTASVTFNGDGTGLYSVSGIERQMTWRSTGDNQIYIEILEHRTKTLDYNLYVDTELELFFSNGAEYFTKVGN